MPMQLEELVRLKLAFPSAMVGRRDESATRSDAGYSYDGQRCAPHRHKRHSEQEHARERRAARRRTASVRHTNTEDRYCQMNGKAASQRLRHTRGMPPSQAAARCSPNLRCKPWRAVHGRDESCKMCLRRTLCPSVVSAARYSLDPTAVHPAACLFCPNIRRKRVGSGQSDTHNGAGICQLKGKLTASTLLTGCAPPILQAHDAKPAKRNCSVIQ